MSKAFFRQSDPKYGSLLRHHAPTATALESIDAAMLAVHTRRRTRK